jgi:hypothetical protein
MQQQPQQQQPPQQQHNMMQQPQQQQSHNSNMNQQWGKQHMNTQSAILNSFLERCAVHFVRFCSSARLSEALIL